MEDLLRQIYRNRQPIFNALYVESYLPPIKIKSNTVEKEVDGEIHEDTTPKEMEIAKEQEDLNESHQHHV